MPSSLCHRDDLLFLSAAVCSVFPGQGLSLCWAVVLVTSIAPSSHPLPFFLDAFWNFTESQNYRITESQNHRMVGVGRDLCGSSGPTPLPKQGHLEQVTFLKPCLLCWAMDCPCLSVLCSPVQRDWGYRGTPSKDASQHSVVPCSIRLVVICVAWNSGTGNTYWAMNITVKIIYAHKQQ